mmetsp:Transcript_101911/g.287593  ORF Transcript_101911/g.287593 Transcript_101911/m.287593 type:complete len:286 (+) Transcript_101911:1025-1882(+)
MQHCGLSRGTTRLAKLLLEGDTLLDQTVQSDNRLCVIHDACVLQVGELDAMNLAWKHNDLSCGEACEFVEHLTRLKPAYIVGRRLHGDHLANVAWGLPTRVLYVETRPCTSEHADDHRAQGLVVPHRTVKRCRTIICSQVDVGVRPNQRVQDVHVAASLYGLMQEGPPSLIGAIHVSPFRDQPGDLIGVVIADGLNEPVAQMRLGSYLSNAGLFFRGSSDKGRRLLSATGCTCLGTPPLLYRRVLGVPCEVLLLLVGIATSMHDAQVVRAMAAHDVREQLLHGDL